MFRAYLFLAVALPFVLSAGPADAADCKCNGRTWKAVTPAVREMLTDDPKASEFAVSRLFLNEALRDLAMAKHRESMKLDFPGNGPYFLSRKKLEDLCRQLDASEAHKCACEKCDCKAPKEKAAPCPCVLDKPCTCKACKGKGTCDCGKDCTCKKKKKAKPKAARSMPFRSGC